MRDGRRAWQHPHHGQRPVAASLPFEHLPLLPAVAVFGVGHVGLELARTCVDRLDRLLGEVAPLPARLAVEGHSATAIARSQCPIGRPEPVGKDSPPSRSGCRRAAPPHRRRCRILTGEARGLRAQPGIDLLGEQGLPVRWQEAGLDRVVGQPGQVGRAEAELVGDRGVVVLRVPTECRSGPPRHSTGCRRLRSARSCQRTRAGRQTLSSPRALPRRCPEGRGSTSHRYRSIGEFGRARAATSRRRMGHSSCSRVLRKGGRGHRVGA